MRREVIDHSAYGSSEITHIYCFYKKDKTNKRILITANTFLEAYDFLIKFNSFANKIYDTSEYRMYDIDKDDLYKVCNIDKDYEGYPYFISEEKFEKLKKYILNYDFSNLHNTKLLTSNILNKLKNKLYS